MLKAIKALLLFLFLFIILLFSILFSGIKINSFSFSNLFVSQFYIKLDKKLIVKVDKIEFTSKKSEVKSSIEDLKKNIELLPSIMNFFQEVDIKNLKIDGNEFSIFIDNDDLYLDNKFVNIVSTLNRASKQLEFNVKSLYLKDYNVLFEGFIELDYFKNEIKYFGDIHYEGIISKTNIDISKDKLKFFTRSEYFKNLYFLKKFLDLPEIANQWMYDNVVGDFKFDWFYGEYDLNKNELIEKSLQGEAHIKNAKIMFHKKVDKIITQNVKVKFKDNVLHFDLIDAKFKDKNLKDSYVTLKNLTDEINGVVDVNIETKTKLDKDVLAILKAYDINLPILQKSGITDAKLLLSFPYDEKKSLNTKGEFIVENSDILIDTFEFKSKKAKVLLENDIVYIKDANFLFKDIIDANADIKIDTKTLKAEGSANISKLLIKDNKNNQIIEVKNLITPLNMDFSKKLDINIQSLNTKLKMEDQLFIIIEDLSKIYNYSKFLQDFSIKSGDLILKVFNENNIDFEAIIGGLDLPLYRNENKVSELNIEGSIKDDSIRVIYKDNSIKIEDTKDKNNVYLKDYKIVDNFSKNINKSFDKNINITLENCSLQQEDDIYDFKNAKVFLTKDEINFEALLENISFPLKKDGEDLKELEITGNIKDDITKISSTDDSLKLELKNDFLKLDIKNLDVILTLKGASKLNYKKLLLNGINSNITINEDYKILADSYIVNLNEKEKFIYLKHKNSEFTFYEYENNDIEILAADLSEEFINTLLNKQVVNGGTINLYANGNYDLFNGKLLIKDSAISNLSILSNLLAFVETTPALAAQLVTLPFNPLFALPAASIGLKNIGVYTLKEGNMEFTYDRNENILRIDNLNTIGNGIDFEGFGVVDLNNFTINAKVNLIFLQDYTTFVRFIPLVNYILLGDQERVETLVDIHGSLGDPKISTNLLKDSFSAPMNIFKRVFTAPVNIFNGLNLSNN